MLNSFEEAAVEAVIEHNLEEPKMHIRIGQLLDKINEITKDVPDQLHMMSFAMLFILDMLSERDKKASNEIRKEICKLLLDE